jgi:DNA-binding response OmpR family regulator
MRWIRNRGPLSSSGYERRIAELQNQLEQAQETILQLRQLLQAQRVKFYNGVKLTKKQKTIVDMLLVTNGICTNESLYAALYLSRQGYKPDPHIIREMVRVIRKQLKPHEIDIENVRGTGYTMKSESKSKLHRLTLTY